MAANGCRAYIEKGGQSLARGGSGLRHRHCKRTATTTRTREEGHWSGPIERTYDLCGQHAAQWDRALDPDGPFANPPNLRSDF